MDFSSFSIEEELPIILLKEYKLSSHVNDYHACMTCLLYTSDAADD